MNNCCTNDIYPQCDMDRWEYVPSSIIQDADLYYTKVEIDEKLEEIVESGCCVTPEEVDEKVSAATDDMATKTWVNNQGFLTEHQPLKTINGQVVSGSGNIVIETSGTSVTVDDSLSLESDNPVENRVITEALNGKLDASAYTPTDLSNYYNKQEVDSLISSISARITQNITNLQQQINYIISSVSGCCSETGETQYRWITMTGSDDYWCDGTTKKALEKEQSSTDGITWTDTGSIRSGSTILEYDSLDCGYDITKGLKITLTDDTTIDVDCEDLSEVQCGGGTIIRLDNSHIMSRVTAATDVKQIEVGSCVDQINYDCFSGMTNLQKVIIPTTFESKYQVNCYSVNVAAFEFTGIRTVGLQGSGADVEWNDNMEEMGGEMFLGCTALLSVELHSKFKVFQGNVFSGCTNLQSITIHSTELPILDSVPASADDGLSNIGNNTFKIYVPSSMVNEYKTSTLSTKNWSKYAAHIYPIT